MVNFLVSVNFLDTLVEEAEKLFLNISSLAAGIWQRFCSLKHEMLSHPRFFSPSIRIHLGVQALAALSLSITVDPPRANAAYEPASSFSRRSSLLPEPPPLSRPTMGAPLSASAHQLALMDADNRVDPAFRVPAPLQNTVSLWLRVYSEYSSEQTLFFDKKHPEVIYEVMDFRDLKRTSRNLMAYEIVRARRLKARMAEYRAAFASLIKKSNRVKLAPETPGLRPLERKILSASLSSNHRHALREWNSGFQIQTGQRDMIVKGLLAAETFFPKMEEIFEEMDIPKELTRIPLVESSFNIGAHSRVGAQGVWQFMPASGREYMKVDPALGIDERLSPLKATVAAARLLRRNLVIAGNWPLAITAYNHGYTGIRKLTPADRSTALDGRLFSLCSENKRRTLGYASSNYYAEFLALLHAEAYKDLFYGDTPMPVAPSLTFHRVNAPITALDYSRRNGIPLQDFRLFNPDIRNLNAKLPVGYYVILPGTEGEIDELISSIKSRPTRTRKFAKKSGGRPNRTAMAEGSPR
jgi:membrane-bound lytic murein transglycosylase D